MIIQFERTGGFTGIPVQATIDTAALDPEAATLLLALLEASRFFELPSLLASKSARPDQFFYKVTITDEDRQHTVVTNEVAASEELLKLLRHLTILARSTPG